MYRLNTILNLDTLFVSYYQTNLMYNKMFLHQLYQHVSKLIRHIQIVLSTTLTQIQSQMVYNGLTFLLLQQLLKHQIYLHVLYI